MFDLGKLWPVIPNIHIFKSRRIKYAGSANLCRWTYSTLIHCIREDELLGGVVVEPLFVSGEHKVIKQLKRIVLGLVGPQCHWWAFNSDRWEVF